MKRTILCALGALLILAGCAPRLEADRPREAGDETLVLYDSGGRAVSVPPGADKTVLALSSSIAEIWLLAGGELAGVTSDATEGRDLGLDDSVALLGTVKDPSVEAILAAKPDLVLLSQDISTHADIAQTLEQAGVPHYMARVDTPDEYLKVLGDFAAITGDAACYARNGTQVAQEVDDLLDRLPADGGDAPTVLFLRAYGSGVKVKAREHTVCTILDDIGAVNIATREGFPLEELSVEAILAADPDYILVVPMGDEAAAAQSLRQSLLDNPAFSALSALQNDRLIVLPKELYHYKPNNQWGKAYEYLLEILYPQTYATH